MVVYRYINALSLDVVLGAVICSLFLGRLLEVNLPISVISILAIAVWAIYTFDHLWDAYRSPQPAPSFRHHFHQHHFRLLLILSVVGVILGLLLFQKLPQATRVWGLMLTLVVAIYFAALALERSKAVYHKELMVALVYSMGIFAGPLSLYSGRISITIGLLFLQFVLLALTNLLIFSYFDLDLDRRQRFGSLALAIGGSNTFKAIIGLLSVIIILTVVGWWTWPNDPVIISSQPVVVIMALSLAGIMAAPDYFKSKERFRILGDAIFFFPVFLL